MITEKALKSINQTKRTVTSVEKALKARNIAYEPIVYEVFLFNAAAYTVLTDNCSIEVWKDSITVNEIPVSNIDEMINEVMSVEV